MCRTTIGAMCGLAALVGCPADGGGPSTGPDSDPPTGAETGETGAPPVECTDPDTELGGESFASRTLQRACSPYHLVASASFRDPGVELVIEPGVVVLAQADARLDVADGARLVAGAAGGEAVVMQTDPTAAGPWAGLVLADADARPHELHEVTLRGAAGTPTSEAGEVALAVLSGGALLDGVRVEAPLDQGLRIRREGAWLAPGSRDIAVIDAGSYPVVMDAQNFAGLPPLQDLSSLDPDADRILLYGGDEGLIVGDVAWPVQSVPVELAVTVSVGTPTAPGSLTLPPTGTILLRQGLHVAFGTLTAVGEDPGCRDDVARCTLAIDTAAPGTLWGSLVFASTASGPESRVANARVANGGGNEPMIDVVSASVPGDEGDCGAGARVEDCWLETSAVCVAVTDSSNAYDTDNSLHGCTADLHCD